MRHAVIVSEEERPFDFTAGRAYWQSLAGWLAAAGEDVVLVDARPAGAPPLAAPEGCRLAILPPAPLPLLRVGREAELAHACDRHLAEAGYDVVHAAEHGGALYHALLARGQGLRHLATRVVIHLRGPSRWRLEAAGQMLDRLADLEAEHMERHVVAHADQIVSPTQALLGWLDARGWIRAADCAVGMLPPAVSRLDKAPSPRGWAFVGHADVPSGLDLFLEAVERLHTTAPEGSPTPVAFVCPAETPALETARKRLEQLGITSEVELAGSLDIMLRVLAERQSVAVAPCPNALLPDHVLACQSAGWPVVANATAGLAGINEGQVRRDAHALSRAMAAALDGNGTNGRSEEASAIPREALTAAPAPRTVPELPAPEAGAPLVSVCLVHFNRPHLLMQALDGLRAQSFTDFEVVLVDDGSTSPEAVAMLTMLEPEFAQRGWRILRQENRYLGAARNAGIQAARGRYVLFMDDDNVAKPKQIETYVRAALTSGADALTCFLDLITGEEPPTPESVHGRLLVAGGSVIEGMFKNCFGDANALIRRDTLLALGGFTELRGIGHEDWELFARLALSGRRLEVVPEALLYYRQTVSSMRLTMPPGPSYRRSLSPYLEHVPTLLADALVLGQGLAVRYERDVAYLEAELALARTRGDALDRHGQGLATHIQELTAHSEELSAHIKGLESHASALASHAEALQAENQALAARLAEIENSPAWKAVKTLRRLSLPL